jgi:hypothetical protein
VKRVTVFTNYHSRLQSRRGPVREPLSQYPSKDFCCVVSRFPIFTGWGVVCLSSEVWGTRIDANYC